MFSTPEVRQRCNQKCSFLQALPAPLEHLHTCATSTARRRTELPFSHRLSSPPLMSIVTLFQHRGVIINIHPSSSLCLAHTVCLPLSRLRQLFPTSLLPLLFSATPRPLSFPFLSFFYAGNPMGTPVFLSNPPLRFLPSCVHAGRRMRKRRRRTRRRRRRAGDVEEYVHYMFH